MVPASWVHAGVSASAATSQAPLEQAAGGAPVTAGVDGSEGLVDDVGVPDLVSRVGAAQVPTPVTQWH